MGQQCVSRPTTPLPGGRGTSQLLSGGGSPVALLGCTEADMDFWCWRGRAAETAEAEAVEARDPGMVRLGDKSSGEAWVRGGKWGQEAWLGSKGGGKGQRGASSRMHVRPRSSNGAQVRAQGGRLWSGGQGVKANRRPLPPGLHWSPRIPRTKDVLSPERAVGCC